MRITKKEWNKITRIGLLGGVTAYIAGLIIGGFGSSIAIKYFNKDISDVLLVNSIAAILTLLTYKLFIIVKKIDD